jgi:CheY-like chemotaxis protein
VSDQIVMLVEDEADIREPLRELLEEEGMTVITASHGQDALDQLEHCTRPRVMVVDLLMPVMNGVELVEKLRGDPRYTTIPVIFLSASSTLAPPEGTRMLRKPVALPRLIEAIRQSFT